MIWFYDYSTPSYTARLNDKIFKDEKIGIFTHPFFYLLSTIEWEIIDVNWKRSVYCMYWFTTKQMCDFRQIIYLSCLSLFLGNMG